MEYDAVRALNVASAREYVTNRPYITEIDQRSISANVRYRNPFDMFSPICSDVSEFENYVYRKLSENALSF